MKGRNRKQIKRTKIPVNISSELNASIKDFLHTKTAQKLGIFSKDRLVESIVIAFLMKYKEEYQALERLYALEEERIKGAKLIENDRRHG